MSISDDEIKRLRELVTGYCLEGDVGGLSTIIDDLLDEMIEKTTTDYFDADGLKDQLAKAVAALEPFAHVADLCEKSKVPEGIYLWTRSSNVPGEPTVEGISLEHVRNARQTLKEIQGEVK